MTQDRLNALALIALESGIPEKIDYEYSIEDFISKNVKRISLFKCYTTDRFLLLVDIHHLGTFSEPQRATGRVIPPSITEEWEQLIVIFTSAVTCRAAAAAKHKMLPSPVKPRAGRDRRPAEFWKLPAQGKEAAGTGNGSSNTTPPVPSGPAFLGDQQGINCCYLDPPSADAQAPLSPLQPLSSRPSQM
uniref:Uncharacterized protein n=1 Tax=Oryza brachyantha TaxID=4533 RepID=J3N8I2_ORYBR